MLMFLPLTRAAEWHVSTDGKTTGHGAKDAPWDIESALGARQEIAPGDTVWIHQGTYKHPFENVGMGFKKLACRSRSQRRDFSHGRTVEMERPVRPREYPWGRSSARAHSSVVRAGDS